MLAVQPDRRWRARLSLAMFLGTAVLTADAAVLGSQAAASSSDPVGDWKLQVEWPSGRADVVLTVTEKDGVLAATWTGPQGQLTADAVTFSDAVLRFALQPQDQNGNPVKLRFEGRIAKGKIDGHLLTPRGGSIKVTGERKSGPGTGRASAESSSRVPSSLLLRASDSCPRDP
jgi:hypothetical protein